jgi:hypothetical protein
MNRKTAADIEQRFRHLETQVSKLEGRESECPMTDVSLEEMIKGWQKYKDACENMKRIYYRPACFVLRRGPDYQMVDKMKKAIKEVNERINDLTKLLNCFKSR